VNSIVRCPRTGRACSEGACRERHWLSAAVRARPVAQRAAFEAQIPTEVLRQDSSQSAVCRESGAAGSARIAKVQRRRWKAFRGVARLSQIPSKTP
jgi:hypothetical protein